MATKVISTSYNLIYRIASMTSTSIQMIFNTKAELKNYLNKINNNVSTGDHFLVEISKREVIWDDSTKYLSTTTTQLTADDL